MAGMLFAFALALDVAVARDVTIAVMDARGSPVSAATLTTPCGCAATTDAVTGTWQGSAVPGVNGVVALVPGAVVELSVTALGYQTLETTLVIAPQRARYEITLRDVVYEDLGQLDFQDFVWYPEVELGTRLVERSDSAFMPPPPPPRPPVTDRSGWDCHKSAR